MIHGQFPIHVGHLIGSTGIYGAERWILAQMRYLDPRRTQASIINLIDKPGERSEIVAEAQKRGCAAIDFFTGGRFNPIAALRLAGLTRKRSISILHSHGYKADLMALMAGRWAGIKVISTPHGWSKENDRKLRLYEKVDRLLLQFFDHLCPLSSELYNDMQTAGVKTSKTTLILNGVDIGEIDEAPARPKTGGKRRIGYIGQFIERKGLEDLVKAYWLLDRPDCELVLIGDGPYRGKILRLAQSGKQGLAIHCPGYSSRRLEDLKSFDMFVLPSLKEGIPRCIMEAHAARVPVIGTDIEGNRDLILHEQTGLLVPRRSPAILASALKRLLDRPEFARSLALNGRSLVEQRFSAKGMAEKYQDLYGSLLIRD